MFKKFLILSFIFISLNLNAQWENNSYDGDDGEIKISNCYSTESKTNILRIENLYDGIHFSLVSYNELCDFENIMVKIVFVFPSGNVVCNVDKAFTQGGIEEIIISTDLEKEKYFEYFKKCSSLRIEVLTSDCGSKYYNFNMLKSSKSIEYVKN
jgi:hypothetical protein